MNRRAFFSLIAGIFVGRKLPAAESGRGLFSNPPLDPGLAFRLAEGHKALMRTLAGRPCLTFDTIGPWIEQISNKALADALNPKREIRLVDPDGSERTITINRQLA